MFAFRLSLGTAVGGRTSAKLASAFWHHPLAPKSFDPSTSPSFPSYAFFIYRTLRTFNRSSCSVSSLSSFLFPRCQIVARFSLIKKNVECYQHSRKMELSFSVTAKLRRIQDYDRVYNLKIGHFMFNISSSITKIRYSCIALSH